jgi:hypothetical protein
VVFTDWSQSGKKSRPPGSRNWKRAMLAVAVEGSGEERGVQGAAEAVDGEDVQTAVANEGRGVGHGVQDAQDAVGQRAAGTPPPGGAFGGGAGQVVEVGAFGVVELEGVRDGVEDFLRGTREMAAFEADVVVDADAGEHGDLFAAQARHAPVAAVSGQAGLLRGDPGAAGGQELADVALGTHAVQAKPDGPGVGGPVSTGNGRPFSSPLTCGFLGDGAIGKIPCV